MTQTFDELLLMKRGGRIIFFGETGYRSQKLIDYFEVNPSCVWMLFQRCVTDCCH